MEGQIGVERGSNERKGKYRRKQGEERKDDRKEENKDYMKNGVMK